MSFDCIISVSSDDIKAFEKAKIKSFERKYGCNIDAFEKKLARSPEDFECWDDFIEWKAYADSLNDLESKSALASGKAHD